VLVTSGLRVHNIHKNAHSAIKLAFKDVDYETSLPEEEGNEYRFMVVRHPLDRIVSTWAFFCCRPVRNMQDYMEKIGYKLKMSFDDFLDLLLLKHKENVHTQKQILFTGGYEMNELCPIEHLNNRWDQLAERFNLNKLPQSHNTSVHNHWKEYYSNEQCQRTEGIFKEDLDLYNLALEK